MVRKEVTRQRRLAGDREHRGAGRQIARRGAERGVRRHARKRLVTQTIDGLLQQSQIARDEQNVAGKDVVLRLLVRQPRLIGPGEHLGDDRVTLVRGLRGRLQAPVPLLRLVDDVHIRLQVLSGERDERHVARGAGLVRHFPDGQRHGVAEHVLDHVLATEVVRGLNLGDVALGLLPVGRRDQFLIHVGLLQRRERARCAPIVPEPGEVPGLDV